MKVELEDVAFWMDAIRNSDDRYRTLESFWKGQLRSKVWLVENLKKYSSQYPSKIVIHGGWNGVLASLLFNSDIPVRHITSIDIDSACEETARTVNKRQEIQGTFSAVTADMTEYEYDADIVINTSCEHISLHHYYIWLSKVPKDALVVIQSNNFHSLPEHVNCVSSLDEFERLSGLDVYFRDSLELELYTRYMLIGRLKNLEK